MTITNNTKYADFAQYESVLDDEGRKALEDAAEQYFKPCYLLTLEEFWGLLNKDFQLLGDISNPSVLQMYWLKRWTAFLEQFTKTCERLEMKEPNAEQIAEGCVKLQPQESMLVFVREYFGYRTFAEAAQCTIGDYVLARKDRYNAWRQRKNNEAIQLSKMKKK